MFWSIVWIAIVMIVSFIFIFIASLLEVVWLTIWDDDVVSYEHRIGKITLVTKTIKALLRERMIVVGFILFAIHLLTYFTPLILGWLSYGMNGWISGMLVAYAILLFFFGEIVSKNVGYKRAMAAAVWSAIPLRMLLHICYPVTWALKQTNRLTGGQERRLFREEDVVAAAQVAQEHGTLSRPETALIRNALRLGNLTVGQVFTPLAKVLTVPLRPTQKQLSDAASQHSHVMVCSDDKTIIGAITRREIIQLLAEDIPHDQPIDLPRESIRGMLDLPQSMLVGEACEFLQGDEKEREKVCEVTNTDGRTIGIITTRHVAFALFKKPGVGEDD